MRRCNSCEREFDNDALNYCSHDGTALSAPYDSEGTLVLTTQLTNNAPLIGIHDQPQQLTNAHGEIQIVELCPRCGNITPQTLLYFHRVVEKEIPWSHGQLLFSCGTCEMALLYYMGDPPELITNEVIIDKKAHPGTMFYLESPDKIKWISHPAIPETIRNCYVDAIKNNNQPDIFASQVRKALELLCDHRQISAGKLSDRLHELSSKYALPQLIFELADALRILGNIGVHSTNNIDVMLYANVDTMFRLLISYIYISPYVLNNHRYHVSRSNSQNSRIGQAR